MRDMEEAINSLMVCQHRPFLPFQDRIKFHWACIMMDIPRRHANGRKILFVKLPDPITVNGRARILQRLAQHMVSKLILKY